MGCRHSSSPPASPSKIRPNGTPVLLRKQISIHRSESNPHRLSNGVKSMTPKSNGSIKKSHNSSVHLASNLFPINSTTMEQTLDGRNQHLVQRFDLDSPCLLLDLSSKHVLLLDNQQLRLIDLETMNFETFSLPIDALEVQDIVWSSKLETFLLLTTDQLYRISAENFYLTPINQIQFIIEGHRKSYMAADDDDLLINRSFGQDIRQYSLSQLSSVESVRIYSEQDKVCVTNIQLNSKKILALSISIGKQQMIDLFDLKTNQLLNRISLKNDENILYPVNFHDNNQWFAKTCIPCANIGHCLISSDGHITRLNLFPNQDNFIRSIRLSSDRRWLIVCRQYALEIYQPYTSILPLIKDLVGFSSTSLK